MGYLWWGEYKLSIIILEGPDGSGKTTLAKEIKKIADKPYYLHLRYKPQYGLRYYSAAFDLAIRKHLQGHTVIMDRWWPSAIIYDTVYRTYNKRDGRHFTKMHQTLLAVGGHYVWCLPSDEKRYTKEITKLTSIRDELFCSGFNVLHDAYAQAMLGLQAEIDRYQDHDLFITQYDRFEDDTEEFTLQLLESL
jgi:hypothetical protein